MRGYHSKEHAHFSLLDDPQLVGIPERELLKTIFGDNERILDRQNRLFIRERNPWFDTQNHILLQWSVING
jgi:hypothetical protein